MAETPFPGQVLAAAELADRLLAGSAALFPTDTVPALAAREEAAAQLWQLKRRPARKPMILMGADAEALLAALDLPIEPQWRAMAERCWPGAVTLVLPARGRLARALHGEGSSLGLRIPACPVALELLRRTGPLATTSANRSSEPPCGTAATHKPPVALQVGVGLDRLEPLGRQQGLNGFGLVVVVLQQQPAARGQGLGGPGGNGAKGIETIGAAIEGQGRFVVAHYGR